MTILERAVPIQLTVYPDECDTFGHLNQAAYLALFERARWALLAAGPGMDAFQRAGIWPAVRRATIDYHAGAWPGDILEFGIEVLQRRRTSFTLRQRAVRPSDQRLIATVDTVFVCIDRDERPVAVPDEIIGAMGGARRVTLSTGVTLAVEDRGGGGTPLLLVHGYPLDRSLWHAQLDGVRGRRVIAPDLRGSGESDRSPDATTLAAHADDLAALLDAMQVERCVFCGLSMGGYIAFEFLRRHPQRVAALVLMDTRAGADSDEGKAGRNAAIVTARDQGAVAIADAMAAKLFAADVDPRIQAAVVAQMSRSAVPGIIAALGAMRDRSDSSALLGSIDVPTLVVVGAEDRLTPPDAAREMADAIAGAELVVIDGAGHLPPVERPAETTAALQHFLDRVM